jgi:hypothetical protein
VSIAITDAQRAAAEGVRQVRGNSVNQVAGTSRLVSAGTGVSMSGLILSR